MQQAPSTCSLKWNIVQCHFLPLLRSQKDPFHQTDGRGGKGKEIILLLYCVSKTRQQTAEKTRLFEISEWSCTRVKALQDLMSPEKFSPRLSEEFRRLKFSLQEETHEDLKPYIAHQHLHAGAGPKLTTNVPSGAAADTPPRLPGAVRALLQLPQPACDPTPAF